MRKKSLQFFILFILFLLLCGCESSKTASESDGACSHESCTLYGDAAVYGLNHQSLYGCAQDGDGWYYPGFGHHHHQWVWDSSTD